MTKISVIYVYARRALDHKRSRSYKSLLSFTFDKMCHYKMFKLVSTHSSDGKKHLKSDSLSTFNGLHEFQSHTHMPINQQ